MQGTQALLFDFDGVLGDSVEDNLRAWQAAFAKLNLPLHPAEYFALEGSKSTEIARKLIPSDIHTEELAIQILKDKSEYYVANNSFSYYPGVHELVAELAKWPIRTAVVSGGSAKRLLTPPSSQILSEFRVVVTGDDCNECKPSPEPYLRAASQLGIAAEHCVVIENAPLGIKAAKRAGMYCIALCSTLTREYLHEADLILEDVPALHEHLRLQLKPNDVASSIGPESSAQV